MNISLLLALAIIYSFCYGMTSKAVSLSTDLHAYFHSQMKSSASVSHDEMADLMSSHLSAIK